MKRTIVCIALLLFLSGCTNSPTVLKVLYGQFDNFMASKLLDYADFTDEQKQEILRAVDQTVEWHRYQALPTYVNMLAEAQARLIDQQPSQADIDWLFQNTIILGREFEKRSPLLSIRSTLSGLSDQQVMQIQRKINDEFADELDEMEKNLKNDPAEISSKNLAKFFKRMGLKLSKQQIEKAKPYFAQRRVSEQDRMPVWRQWTDELIQILERRQQPTFFTEFESHYTSRLNLIERTFTEDWRHDQKLSKAMLLDLFTSLSDKQKQSMRKRWATLRSVATDLAAK